MERESGVARSIIDEDHSSDIQGDQVESERAVTRSIMEELPSWHIQGDQMESESMVVLEVSSMIFILM